jgi:hypothetical protein
MGQLTRFEDVLLASMGEYYILPHPWVADGANSWYVKFSMSIIKRLKENGVTVGAYRPPRYPATRLKVDDLERIVEEHDRRTRERLERYAERHGKEALEEK